MVATFSLESYTGSDKEKLSLVELASTMFLATDFNLGKIVVDDKTFGLNEDTILNFCKARTWYDANKEKFDQAFLPVCEYDKMEYSELGIEESYKIR